MRRVFYLLMTNSVMSPSSLKADMHTIFISFLSAPLSIRNGTPKIDAESILVKQSPINFFLPFAESPFLCVLDSVNTARCSSQAVYSSIELPAFWPITFHSHRDSRRWYERWLRRDDKQHFALCYIQSTFWQIEGQTLASPLFARLLWTA